VRQRLEAILSEALAQLLEAPSVHVIELLGYKLAKSFDQAKGEGWLKEFRAICQAHPLSKIVLEDPYSRRAFEKPRGYAGDAIMLDYIYKPAKSDRPSLGAIIHEATTGLSTAKSILWRRDYLSRQICVVMNRCAQAARVLSVASGHMRELDAVTASTNCREIEIWAFDQDKASLDECVRSYPEFLIRKINQSISHLFKGETPAENLDLIYTAGLCDYLTDRTLVALLRKLHSCLGPSGLLVISNFTPDSDGRGFMEGMMDWSLVYRDESNLVRIAEEALPGAVREVFRDEPGNVAYVEVAK